jgi:hypothetical protein
MPEKEDDKVQQPMNVRRITLEDGRYMIFYTFGDEVPEGAVSEADV